MDVSGAREVFVSFFFFFLYKCREVWTLSEEFRKIFDRKIQCNSNEQLFVFLNQNMHNRLPARPHRDQKDRQSGIHCFTLKAAHLFRITYWGLLLWKGYRWILFWKVTTSFMFTVTFIQTLNIRLLFLTGPLSKRPLRKIANKKVVSSLNSFFFRKYVGIRAPLLDICHTVLILEYLLEKCIQKSSQLA